MKKVLIPTDFSQNSWNAISYGLSFLKEKECTFYLLHVETHNPYVFEDNVYNAAPTLAKSSSKVKENMKVLLDKIKKQYPNLKHQFETVFESLFFVDSIRKQISEKEIDLIVMGTKGASGIKEMTIGTNTGDVITKVKCPVLVVPENARYTPVKRIALPTDYNIYYKSKIVETVKEFISFNKATLKILHVAKKEKELTECQQKNKSYLHESLDDTAHGFYFLSNENIEQAVQSFVDSYDIDLITMVAKNLNFFQRILFRPLVEKISYHTEIPFLILHE
ncbi:universal stress protein [Aquimarina brevivitae]|uniref:Nucleotide-binding universal stress UspA family protein n=1 Tax=Aquimarina brevivitae TaxID=323412 RepID=A0A4Q7PH26_9FLAO|nr:universal stress protein [Aquimarina brevivitae]RZS99685.1 nucleotide-binding universal stress UspA family protein [Aquimarina brevivitae]